MVPNAWCNYDNYSYFLHIYMYYMSVWFWSSPGVDKKVSLETLMDKVTDFTGEWKLL